MEYTNFVIQYNTAKDKEAFCKKHVTTKYVPYADKMSKASGIAYASTHSVPDQPQIYKKNTPALYFSTIIRLLSLYTDIEYDEKNVVDVYDKLSECGALNILLSAIPESEVTEFRALVDMYVSDIYESERDISSVIENKMEAIRLVANTVLEPFGDTLNKIDVNELVKDKITPFPTDKVKAEDAEENDE